MCTLQRAHSLSKQCPFLADLSHVAFGGARKAACVRRRTVLSQLRSGRYAGVAFPHNVLRRGALQYRGSSGVFFERYAVRPTFAGGKRQAAYRKADKDVQQLCL